MDLKPAPLTATRGLTWDKDQPSQEGKVLEWRPHKAQQHILQSDARFPIVRAGRRFGKTSVAGAWLFQEAHRLIDQGHDPGSLTLWWCADIYKHAEAALDKLVKATDPMGNPNPFREVVVDDTRSPGNMRATTTWGFDIEYRSADRARALVAEGVHAAVFDEAAAARERSWDEELLPALTDIGARCLLISTPKGRNWFWRKCREGRKTHTEYEEFHFTTYDNPFLPEHSVEKLVESMTPRGHKQEILAEFLQDAGAVFSNPHQCVVDEAPVKVISDTPGRYTIADTRHPQAGTAYVAGWDPAKHQDWSAFIIDHAPTRHTVLFDRFQRVPYHKQAARVAWWCARYHANLLMEVNAAGDPVLEQVVKLANGDLITRLMDAGAEVPDEWHTRLEEQGGLFKVIPWKTTKATKQNMIDNLATLVGQRATSWPDIPILTNEMEIMEYDDKGSANAPEGEHDDTVDAKALACMLAAHHQQVDQDDDKTLLDHLYG